MPVKLGIVGAGKIARYAPQSIASHDDAELVAAYDPHAERLAEYKEEAKIPRTHDSLEALLGDDEIDAVYVAVPNKFHAPIALDVLKSGRHLLLEKPFALNYGEARSVVDAAEASGNVFCLGMNQRFPAGRQRVRRLVRDGVLGEVYHGKACWFRRAGIPRLQTWFGHKELSGGGCLLDIGVHMLDAVMYMADNFKPTSVLGQTYSKFGHRGQGEGGWGLSDRDPSLDFDVDDFASALITFENGLTIGLDVSWAAYQEHGSVDGGKLFGTEGGASVDPAKIFTRPDPEGDFVVRELGDDSDVPMEYPHCDRFHNFINAILGREKVATPPSESLVVQKVLDAIYESSRTGKQVAIQPETN